jgi:putative MATE family efflux protein
MLKPNHVDMTTGPLFGKIVMFAIPVALANLLSITFDAADLAVIGRWSLYGHKSLAAIGATNAITTLMLILTFGIAGGAQVVAAQCYGAKDNRGICHAFHTGVALGVVSGLVLMVLGMSLSRAFMLLMRTPADIIDSATLYLRLRFLGIPFTMIYIFGCVLMRAVGDTRRPLFFLLVAGLVNLGLNMFFVIVFKWDVAGVAVATAVSKAVSALLVMIALMRNPAPCRIMPSKIRLYWPELKRILWIGVPSGLQSSSYAISNVIIAGAINMLGSLAVAGNTASGMVESVIHVGTFAMYHSVLAFGGQNYGAQEYRRAARAFLICGAISVSFNLVFGWGAYLCGRQLLGVVNPDPQVIEQGMLRFQVNFTTYFIAGVLDVVGGGLRSLGRSVSPMVVTMMCVCVFRVIWIFTVFPKYHTPTSLYVSYPISWSLVVLINGTTLFFVCRKLILHGEDPDRLVRRKQTAR